MTRIKGSGITEIPKQIGRSVNFKSDNCTFDKFAESEKAHLKFLNTKYGVVGPILTYDQNLRLRNYEKSRKQIGRSSNFKTDNCTFDRFAESDTVTTFEYTMSVVGPIFANDN